MERHDRSFSLYLRVVGLIAEAGVDDMECEGLEMECLFSFTSLNSEIDRRLHMYLSFLV